MRMSRATPLATLALLPSVVLSGQDIAGDWQGVLKSPRAEIRVVIKIQKDAAGGWKATEFTPDEGSNGVPTSAMALQGSTLNLAFDRIRAKYEGSIAEDGTSIAGTWTQGGSFPLDLRRATEQTSWLRDTTPHDIQFVTVEDDVELEVLDWGGSGRPLVLLHGGSNNAHGFDRFALALTSSYRVYGITRRGSGVSSAPAPSGGNYSADRLGDDVLAVIDALGLDRPVLVGHSLGGQELSSIGSRHPEKVSGLIYLDAAYQYAYYDRSKGDLFIEVNEVRRKLELFGPGNMPQDPRPLIDELLETNLPELERTLRRIRERFKSTPPPTAPATPRPRPTIPPVQAAISAGTQRYTDIPAPILAIYALQTVSGPEGSRARVASAARNQTKLDQARAFEAGLPSAKVVRLANANHYVFRSNEGDVLREMEAFIADLPK